MASNLSQITDAIAGINATISNIDTSNLVNDAITSTNAQSGGWIGILVLLIFGLSTLLFVHRNQRGFGVIERTSLFMISLSIILDLGMYLLIWRILESLQIYTFMYVVFFVIGVFSFLKKESQSTEQ